MVATRELPPQWRTTVGRVRRGLNTMKKAHARTFYVNVVRACRASRRPAARAAPVTLMPARPAREQHALLLAQRGREEHRRRRSPRPQHGHKVGGRQCQSRQEPSRRAPCRPRRSQEPPHSASEHATLSRAAGPAASMSPSSLPPPLSTSPSSPPTTLSSPMKQHITGTTRPALRESLSTNRRTRVRGLFEARLHADSLPDL